jgi:tRNA dimethylallyltransferase
MGVFEKNATAAQAIGYKELLGYIHGNATLDEATEALKLATRHYAKRQMTWFSAKEYVRWVYADTETGAMRRSEDVLAEALGICREVLL